MKAFFEEYERKANSEIRSLINQFKLHLYKEDLKPIAMPYVKKEIEKENAVNCCDRRKRSPLNRKNG